MPYGGNNIQRHARSTGTEKRPRDANGWDMFVSMKNEAALAADAMAFSSGPFP